MKRTVSVLLTLIMVLTIMAPMTILSYAAEAEVTKSSYLCTKKDYSEKTGNEKLSSVTTNTYDKNGNLTKNVRISKDSGGVYSDTYKYTYDSKGRISEETAVFDYGDGFVSSQTKKYTYNGKGNVVKSEVSYDNGALESITIYTYDSNDKLIKAVEDTDYGEGITSKATVTYFYDANGNVSKQIINSDNNSVRTNTYTYDSKGNEIKRVSSRISPEGKTGKTVFTNKYDKNGRLIKKAYSDTESDGYSFSYSFVYAYNENGALKKETYTENDKGEKYIGVTTYTYDSKGNLLKTQFTVKSGESDYKSSDVYSYDKKNRVVKKATTSTEFGKTGTDTYTYTYDNKGNEIKCVNTSVNADGKKETVTTAREYDKNGNLKKETVKNSNKDGYSTTYNYIKSDKVNYYFEESGITCSFKNNFTYTGKAITPAVAITNNENTFYLKGADYRLIYKNNKKPGTATIIVDFLDSFDNDDLILNFTIAPQKVTGLKAKSVSKTSAKLSWEKVAGAKYYMIERSTDGKKWTAVSTVSDTKATVKSLKAGTNYRFRVKALDSSKKVAGKASAVVKVTTKK